MAATVVVVASSMVEGSGAVVVSIERWAWSKPPPGGEEEGRAAGTAHAARRRVSLAALFPVAGWPAQNPSRPRDRLVWAGGPVAGHAYCGRAQSPSLSGARVPCCRVALCYRRSVSGQDRAPLPSPSSAWWGERCAWEEERRPSGVREVEQRRRVRSAPRRS